MSVAARKDAQRVAAGASSVVRPINDTLRAITCLCLINAKTKRGRYVHGVQDKG
jgi:hypothetical protein